MNCCVPTGLAADIEPGTSSEEILLASRLVADGVRQTDLSVPAVHCGACIRTVERTLSALEGVEQARVNLSTRRVTIRWDAGRPPPAFIPALDRIGYAAHLYDGEPEAGDGTLGQLVRALAVAGFAASNIMLLSVSVWSGADPATRVLFHWLSAFIAIPVVAYSGRVFFQSAWSALRHGRTNMDVPISIGVLLAVGLSLYETIVHGHHAYYDASVSLLFFLLIGRTLDHMMRDRARTAVRGLARLAARGAMVARPDGTRTYLPIAEIEPGMVILVAAGDRVPVDGRIDDGRSSLDLSLVSGESTPQAAGPGDVLQAGTLNLTAPLTIVATAAAKDSFLAEITRLMETAEHGRSAYRRIADRASRLYAPVVHLAAFLTFLGWMIFVGDLHQALTIAIAVLIITCPCALGLAVPMVQVVAAGRLFQMGVMAKDGGALERIAEVDTVVFDKTGTLTLAEPRLIDESSFDLAILSLAAALAARSRHPYSRAITAAAGRIASATLEMPPPAFTAIEELPGLGLEARMEGRAYRLGRRDWALGETDSTVTDAAAVVFARDGVPLATFRFNDALRPDAAAAIATLEAGGMEISIVSGDHEDAVARLAASLGIPHAARVSPGGKAAHIAALIAAGRKPLMVGDGLNDGPALMVAHASMAPASAADVGRNAADMVFLRDSLMAVPEAIALARAAGRLVQQNLVIAVVYNAIAMPIAIAGFVTPLVAAVAMSVSSLIVIGNAVRLQRRRTPSKSVPRSVPHPSAFPAPEAA